VIARGIGGIVVGTLGMSNLLIMACWSAVTVLTLNDDEDDRGSGSSLLSTSSLSVDVVITAATIADALSDEDEFDKGDD